MLHVDVIILYMFMATVAKKSIPIVSAAALSFLESISSVDDPSYAETSWAVMRRIMPVTASQRLTFQKFKGTCTV
jgi:hypothetical protein